jgi:pyruvate/2-oxoglutarate/acetoin dehydrogenase E1 component
LFYYALATIASQVFDCPDAPVEPLAALDCPTPCNTRLMEAVLPSVDRIRQRMQFLLDY